MFYNRLNLKTKCPESIWKNCKRNKIVYEGIICTLLKERREKPWTYNYIPFWASVDSAANPVHDLVATNQITFTSVTATADILLPLLYFYLLLQLWVCVEISFSLWLSFLSVYDKYSSFLTLTAAVDVRSRQLLCRRQSFIPYQSDHRDHTVGRRTFFYRMLWK